MSKLNEIVREMLEKHEGGKEFFNNLDPALQDKEIVGELWKKIPGALIITTGSFGRFFSNWLTYHNIVSPVFVMDGGIRDGKPLTDLSPFKMEIFRRPFVIVDDSYYSGRTSRAIRKQLEELGATYNGTYVIYDGSFHNHDDVTSLYRYHNRDLDESK